MGKTVTIGPDLIDALVEQAASAWPDEACGLLLGSDACIEQGVAARNVHPTPQTHFEIDPQALVDAHRSARRGGLGVVGYYHSHPTGLAEPSVTDSAMAAGDTRIWAIVAGDDVTFWRDDEDGFVELSYIVTDR